MMPRVTVRVRPCGVPTANTVWPTKRSSESPKSAVAKLRLRRLIASRSMRSSARSVQWSQPTSLALTRSRLARVTETSTACGLTTWALVSTRPSLEMMTPEPTPPVMRLAPSLNSISRTSMRTTASSKRLKPRLMAASAEAVRPSKTRVMAARRAVIDGGRECLNVAGFNNRWLPTAKTTTFSKSSRIGNLSGRKPRHLRPRMARPSRNTTCWTCSPTRQGPGCTSAIRRATPPPTFSPVSSAPRASTSSTRSAGMPSACPPSSTP